MRVRVGIVIGGLIAVAVVVAALRKPAGEAQPTWESITVRTGPVIDRLRETGTLMPRDPVIVPVPFDGKLQWVIDDSTWVQPGEPLFIIDDAEELKKVAGERSQLTEATQNRELAVLKRDQAGDTEERKVHQAIQALTIEQARHRILTSAPVGGLELVRLDAELVPLEAVTTAVRTRFEIARGAWQQAQDAFVDQLDLWQDHQDHLLRLENRLDEVNQQLKEAVAKPRQRAPGAAGEQSPGKRRPPAVTPKPDAAQKNAADPDADSPPEPTVEIAQITSERDTLRAATAGLQQALAAARAARAALTPAKESAAGELIAAETAERELRIRIEIEKRALPAIQLALDVELAGLTLSEAERRLADGQTAFSARTLAQAALDDLRAERDSARTQATIVAERLAIAARPVSPEIVAEAAARLAKAEQAAADSRAVRDRNLAILDQERAVLDAKIARLTASLAVRARRFPSTIEQEISARERERSLKPENAVDLDRELAALRADLVKAKATPPSIASAAVAGLVKVRREGDRQKLAGDAVWQADPMIEIFTPANMEVVVRVNEVNVTRIRRGMVVAAEIPALGRLPRTGVITQVAGVGRDKNESSGKDGSGKRGQAGVTQFEVHISLDPGTDHHDGDFRQGMTALVAIELQKLTAVRWLPRAAVITLPDGRFAVRLSRDQALTAVSGRIVGSDAFVTDDPELADGVVVQVLRFPNQ